ncbi:hypothetical protein [Aliikangiella maris]|uniref:Chemotaxis protein n=2 Tax=Aliikangiella maris TaxID=3162458 RepID=A0ABV3MIW6_9GAMM
MASSNKAAETFISVAHVASELFRAQSIAEELSITSKNARALAVRAGSTAAGFNEITRFIEGLSKLTIDAARKVNIIAISQTKIASDLFRSQGFISRLDVVRNSSADKVNQLLPIYSEVNHKRTELDKSISSGLRELVDRLDETKMELRATQVVSVVSRVEASRAHEDFQNSLNSVADKVSSAGQRINKHLENARRHLAYLQY